MTDINSLYTTDEKTGLRIAVPGFNQGAISINSLGFRGPEIAMPKPPNRIRIAFLGASTTISAEVTSNEATWPHLVTAALAERFPLHEFDYVNGGVGGFTIASSLKNLNLRVKGTDPDIIVIYHATNDLSVNSREAARRQGLEFPHGESDMNWLARYSILWHLVEKNLALRHRKTESKKQGNKLLVDPEALAVPFEQDLAALVAASSKVAEVVAVVTFSTQIRADQDAERRLEAAANSIYYMPYMGPDGLLSSFASYNRAVVRVAREQGVVLIEGEDDIPGDPAHFVDTVHFNDTGSRVMAKRVVDGLLASGALSNVGLPH